MVAQRERFFPFVIIRSCRVIFCWKGLRQVFLYECNIFSGKFMLKHSSILSEECLYHYAEQDAR